MKFRKKQRNKISSPIYVISLVNVVFLLMVFFLTIPSSQFKLGQATQPGYPTLATNPVNVDVQPEKVTMDGKLCDPQSLSRLPHDKDIIITASPEIAYSKVIAVLDALRSSGHTRLSIATTPIHN
jgi:biopolymer transport protein ExbD